MMTAGCQYLKARPELTAVALALTIALPHDLRADAREDKQEARHKELTEQVQTATDLFTKTDPDLKKLFDQSPGYVVFPKIAKGAAGVGAAHGTGQVFEKGQAVGDAKVTQITIGFQLGGQVYSEVIFFETARKLEDFKEGRLEFSAQVSAVAAAEGASKNAKFDQGVAVFTLAGKGLMYEASVGGQKFSYQAYGRK